MKAKIFNILIIAGALGCASAAYALPQSHYSTRSRLSSGKWVRIKVTRTGMQAISFDQLREWGFADPSKVAVYGYGGVEMSRTSSFSENIPDDLCQTASWVKANGDRLIFYGEATERINPMSYNSLEYLHNIYDNCGYYFLSDSEDRKDISAGKKKFNSSYAGKNPRTVHYFAQIIQPDDHNHMGGGAYWLGPELSTDSSIEFSFPIKGFKTNNGLVDYGYMGYTFVAAKEKETTTLSAELLTRNVEETYRNHRSTASANDGTTYFNVSNGATRYVPVSDNALEDAVLRYSFKLEEGEIAPRFAAIKNVWTIYPRRNDMYGENQMAMTFTSTQSRQNFVIYSPTQVEVWNIGDPLDIYAYETRYSRSDGYTTGTFDKQYNSGTSAGRMIAFDPDGELHTPEFDCNVENQNIHGDATPEMAIITTDDLYDAACELAEIHERHGNKVNVYTHTQVLNEFGSGTASPMAYRMMAKMFYDRDPQKFKALLLYGPTTWDFRGIYTPQGQNLLTFLADRESHYKEASANYSSDAYFGMLEDDYNPASIEYAHHNVAVGRLNVPNSSSGHDVNMKIQDYLDNPLDPAVFARMILMTDKGDANAHFLQGQNVADDAIASNPAFTTTRIHMSIYPMSNQYATLSTNKAIEALTMGQGLFDYSGHGDATSCGSDNTQLWGKTAISRLNNQSLPIAMMSTCSNYYFDHTNNDVVTSFVFKAQGGAIAGIGACRKVYLVYNGIFNSAIAKAYAEATPGMTLGQMYINAREMAIVNAEQGQGALANNLCYNLCGDPLTKLPVPDYTAKITAIGGKTPTKDTPVSMAPGNGFTISGNITDAQGNLIKDFNGTIRAIVYDGPVKRRQVITTGIDTALTVDIEEDILAEIGGRVNAGQFNIDLCLPQPRTAGVRNRIVLSAIADGTPHRGALGHTDYFVIDVNAPVDNPQEGKAPVINNVYIDTPDFRNGSELNAGQSHTFYALVEAPGTGISNSTALIGAQPRLILDNNRDQAGIASNYVIDKNGNYLFSLPISDGFSAGQHSLTFSLSNTLGEYTSRTINFILAPATYNVDVEISEKTATEYATINVESDAEATENRVIITDATGNTVFSASNVNFPYRWQLNSNSGSKVADGPYGVQVLLRDSKGNGSSEMKKIIVVRD